MLQPIRVYTDTSVFGGAHDPEFAIASRDFFDRAREGLLDVVVSTLVLDEIADAPPKVKVFFAEAIPFIETVELDDAAYTLQEAYLDRGVVGLKWEADALHVATVTVSGCMGIVSWNFKHIVNFRRIPLYNEVNMAYGYRLIAIHTPPEVIFDEDE